MKRSRHVATVGIYDKHNPAKMSKMEVFLCDCGMMLGYDLLYVLNVSDDTEIKCPLCGEAVTATDLYRMT